MNNQEESVVMVAKHDQRGSQCGTRGQSVGALPLQSIIDKELSWLAKNNKTVSKAEDGIDRILFKSKPTDILYQK